MKISHFLSLFTGSHPSKFVIASAGEKGLGVFHTHELQLGDCLHFPDDILLKLDIVNDLFQEFPHSFSMFPKEKLWDLQKKVYSNNTQLVHDLLLLRYWKDFPQAVKEEIQTLTCKEESITPRHVELNALALECGVQDFDLLRLGGIVQANKRSILYQNKDISIYLWRTYSRLNHSCQPNLHFLRIENNHAIFKVLKNIPAGTELTFEYGDRNFICLCDKCQTLSNQ